MAMPQQPLEPSGRGGSPPGRAGRSGLAAVARRWSRWAGNLLVAGIILIVGLSFGRQVVRWWRAGWPRPADLSSQVLGRSEIGQVGLLHLLEFGDNKSSLYCKTIWGDRQSALEQLRRQSRDVASTAQPATSRPGPAEARWLRLTAGHEPVEEKPGAWQIFQLNGPLPLVVTVRDWAATSQPTPSVDNGTMGRRVVSWAVAIPGPDGGDRPTRQWALFLCTGGKSAGQSSQACVRIPLPPGSTRTMAISASGGGAVIGFQGTGSPEDWTEFFDRVGRQRGWRRQSAWRNERASWHNGFMSARREAVHVTFAAGDGHRLQGLVTIWPTDRAGGER